jgi:hypothetical protein
MKTQKLRSALFLLLMTSTSSFAEDAASVQAAIQAYVGSEPGVVAVTAAGDAYEIAIDVAPYLKKITQPGFTSKVDVLKMNAKPNGDGTWAVSSTGPFSISAEVPNVFSFNMGLKNQDYSGTYSTAVQTFLESKYDISGMTLSQRTVDPTSQMVNTSATGIEKITGTGSATDLGNGTADSQSKFNFAGLVSSSKFEPTAGASAETSTQGFSYTWTAPTGTYETDGKGLTSKAIMDLAAFAVSHPSKELVLKDQALLKEKLLAALPAFASVIGGYSFENVTIDSGLGKFGIASLGVKADMNGAVKTGRLAESFAISGLSLPEGLPLPPWSKGLIPTDVKIGFDVSNFDLETPARKFITEMDISKPEPVPPGSEAAYLAAFAPSNSVKLTIPPGLIAAPLYSFDYEAVTDISFAGLPTVTAKVSMTGMEAVIAQLQQAAADPTAQQAMAGLFAAKGIGKVDGDKTVWDITMGADGKLFVNGTDISAMTGMAPPPQQ